MQLGYEAIHTVVDSWMLDEFALAAEVNARKANLYASKCEGARAKAYFESLAKINDRTAQELRSLRVQLKRRPGGELLG